MRKYWINAIFLKIIAFLLIHVSLKRKLAIFIHRILRILLLRWHHHQNQCNSFRKQSFWHTVTQAMCMVPNLILIGFWATFVSILCKNLYISEENIQLCIGHFGNVFSTCIKLCDISSKCRSCQIIWLWSRTNRLSTDFYGFHSINISVSEISFSLSFCLWLSHFSN